jgi:hypothetical protein
MLGKESRKCSFCGQIKLMHQFPKASTSERSSLKAYLCFACQKNLIFDTEDDDQGGSGGKQLQQSRDAKHLQYAMELEANLQKDLEALDREKLEKNIVGMSRLFDNEKQTQAKQRELLDQKEKTNHQLDQEDNPEYTNDTQVKRERITRLFSVTRHLARNYVASNLAREQNKRAALAQQKNFFSQTAEQQAVTNKKSISSTTDKSLSKETATLFAQHSTEKPSASDTAEKLEKIIREAQNIFKR